MASAVEVRLAGAVDAADAPRVHAALEALAGRPPARVARHELLLAPPPPPPGSGDRGGGELRLSRDVGSQEEREGGGGAPLADDATTTSWTARSVRAAVRGRAAAAAPAQARQVASARVAGADAPAFFCALGFRPSSDRFFEGVEYALVLAGQRVRVGVGALHRVAPGPGPPRARAADAAPGLTLVDAVAVAPEAD